MKKNEQKKRTKVDCRMVLVGVRTLSERRVEKDE